MHGAPRGGRALRRAVAAPAVRNAAAYYNTQPSILLTVYKQPDANVIATVERIKSELPQLVSDIPRAITIDTVLDRTVTIRAAVHDVEFTLVLGVILEVLVVLLFLRKIGRAHV